MTRTNQKSISTVANKSFWGILGHFSIRNRKNTPCRLSTTAYSTFVQKQKPILFSRKYRPHNTAVPDGPQNVHPSELGPWNAQPSDFIINLLKPTGYVMHQQFNIQQLYALPTLYLYVLYLSENKQRLVPLTA